MTSLSALLALDAMARPSGDGLKPELRIAIERQRLVRHLSRASDLAAGTYRVTSLRRSSHKPAEADAGDADVGPEQAAIHAED